MAIKKLSWLKSLSKSGGKEPEFMATVTQDSPESISFEEEELINSRLKREEKELQEEFEYEITTELAIEREINNQIDQDRTIEIEQVIAYQSSESIQNEINPENKNHDLLLSNTNDPSVDPNSKIEISVPKNQHELEKKALITKSQNEMKQEREKTKVRNEINKDFVKKLKLKLDTDNKKRLVIEKKMLDSEKSINKEHLLMRNDIDTFSF